MEQKAGPFYQQAPDEALAAPAEAIIAAATSAKADLIVMTSYGQSARLTQEVKLTMDSAAKLL
jgi:hypothetical protein